MDYQWNSKINLNKNKLYREFLKSKDSFWYQIYKYYRDTLNHLIRKSKRNHYRSYFETFKNNSKLIWKGINEIMNKRSNKSQNNITLQLNGSLIQDQKQVANIFNDYFTGVAQNLINKLGKSITSFSDYLKDPVANSFMISPVTESEVLDQLSNLDISKAADAYDIPVKEICKPLTTLINLSFCNGYFPTSLRYAKVMPIFKANSKLQVSNYRPISLLSIFNTIFEKLMYSRLFDFLTKHKILYPQ